MKQAETYTATDLLKYTFEPRRQYRFIFNHEAIPNYLILNVDMSNKDVIHVTFYDTETTMAFEKLLKDMYTQTCHTAHYKTLTAEGKVLSDVNLGRLQTISVKPNNLDYKKEDPILFSATFQRIGENSHQLEATG